MKNKEIFFFLTFFAFGQLHSSNADRFIDLGTHNQEKVLVTHWELYTLHHYQEKFCEYSKQKRLPEARSKILTCLKFFSSMTVVMVLLDYWFKNEKQIEQVVPACLSALSFVHLLFCDELLSYRNQAMTQILSECNNKVKIRASLIEGLKVYPRPYDTLKFDPDFLQKLKNYREQNKIG
jgi:hypothetical protein